MCCEEFKQLCWKSWGDEYVILGFDRSTEIKEIIVFWMRAKTHTLNVFRKLKLFEVLKK